MQVAKLNFFGTLILMKAKKSEEKRRSGVSNFILDICSVENLHYFLGRWQLFVL
jgi:hypothetical protein